MDGHVDLRYLFTYPATRAEFTFDLMKMTDNKVMMVPFEENIPEEWLPSPRFFCTSHTEDDPESENPRDEQMLTVDGEWDMPDFGEFYSKYSDVYYFLSASHSFTDETVDLEKKKAIKKTFVHTPFKGGFSYVHFYGMLPAVVPRSERLRMDKIKYESPGYVNVNGDAETFLETKSIIKSFLENRIVLRKLYSDFYDFLSKRRYLAMAAEDFLPADVSFAYIDGTATSLAEKMSLPNIDISKSLTEGNPLAFAKIVLSLYRRLDDASKFFAQGRMNFG
ncbi:hypothetical protein [Bradyrhizobium sp. CCGE-LA001]|uniref:hypothetical protein n=1 Tax=Bradyrhizobium sp. CCGE-LA001 TaxID=1223566 RepID=UPI001198232F|nr:hypothetical protein [Bradyrhizobium sp. CCGE-LA001]